MSSHREDYTLFGLFGSFWPSLPWGGSQLVTDLQCELMCVAQHRYSNMLTMKRSGKKWGIKFLTGNRCQKMFEGWTSISFAWWIHLSMRWRMWNFASCLFCIVISCIGISILWVLHVDITSDKWLWRGHGDPPSHWLTDEFVTKSWLKFIPQTPHETC